MHIAMRGGDVSFAATASFLFGIFAANMGWNIFIFGATGVFCGVFAIAFFSIRQCGLWKYIALLLFALAAGMIYYHAYVHWTAAHTHMPSGKEAAFFGVVTEDPKAAGKFTMLVVALSHPYAGTVDIFTTQNNTEFHYGDEIWIRGSMMAASAEDAGEPPAIFLPTLRVVAEHEGFWLKEAMINLKAAIEEKIVQALPADQAALLVGILLGTSGTLGVALKEQMETSGTSYIVNMYGYKIAIITAALAAALKDRIPRWALLWTTLAVVALFVFASGGTTSAIRAAIMGSFAIVARGTGRVFSARNAVTFAALGMVLLNATLLTDAGFQLSFLSFLGIYYLGPPINNFFRWSDGDGGVLQWKEHAMLSLATNLAILPIVMNTFGEFSLTSFISNILIMIPWVAVIGFGALTALFGAVSPVLSFCVAQITSALLQYELFVIHLFAALAVETPAVFGSSYAIALYYGILIIVAYYYAAPSQKVH